MFPSTLLRAAAAAVLATLPLLYSAVSAHAAGPIWLDTPLVRWNGPDAGVPRPPVQTNTRTGAPLDVQAMCRRQQRGPANEAEKQVAAAGWWLESYWPAAQWSDVTVVVANGWYDGMCRPWAYQAFAFVGDRFAGTLSPVTMNSRFDGMLDGTPTIRPGAIIDATFTRYADSDALCCPSLPKVAVQYELTAVGGGRVFTPTAARLVPLPELRPTPVGPAVPARLPNTGDDLTLVALAALLAGIASVVAGVRNMRPAPRPIPVRDRSGR